jgi:integrase
LDALIAYCQNGFRPVIARNRKDAKKLKPASLAYYEQRVDALLQSWPGQPKVEKASWTSFKHNHPQRTWTDFRRHIWTEYKLAQIEIRKIMEGDCKAWADQAREKMSATVFNHTLGVLRNIIDYRIKAAARYDNPAKVLMRESEMEKPLELPDAKIFQTFVNEIENGGGGFSKACANLVRFLAYGGLRKGEAAFVTWADCDFERDQITIRGHPETGLKNRKPAKSVGSE